MTSKQPVWRATALGIIALTGLCGLAATQKHINETCGDNSIASFWDHGSGGDLDSDESNTRWDFFKTANTGQASFSGFHYNLHGINWRKDFDGSLKYHINVGGIDPGEAFFLGAVFTPLDDFPEVVRGFGVGLLKDSTGLRLGIVAFSNGFLNEFHGVYITQKTGTFDFDYDKANDRVTITRRGTKETVHMQGPYSWDGGAFAAANGTKPMHINVGVFTIGGNFSLGDGAVYADSFGLNYYSRAFP